MTNPYINPTKGFYTLAIFTWVFGFVGILFGLVIMGAGNWVIGILVSGCGLLLISLATIGGPLVHILENSTTEKLEPFK